MDIVIPVWVLGVVAFVGITCAGVYLGERAAVKEEKKQKARRELKSKQEKERKAREKRSLEMEAEQEAEEERQKTEEEKQEEQRLSSLLPGPWRILYDFLSGHDEMSREIVLLSARAFRRHVRGLASVPIICPDGFELILQVSYYTTPITTTTATTLTGVGHCHKEFAAILGEYVKFQQFAESTIPDVGSGEPAVACKYDLQLQ